MPYEELLVNHHHFIQRFSLCSHPSGYLVSVGLAYENAYRLIEDMLEDKCPMDFAEAVFAVENCMYDGKLDHASYLSELNRITIGIEHMANSPAYQVGSDLGNSSMFILKEIRDFFNPSNKK